MKIDEAIDYFKSKVLLAGMLGVSVQTITNWKNSGKVPKIAQLAIQTLTRNKLKASDDDNQNIQRN